VDLVLDLQIVTGEAPVPAETDLARWAEAALAGRRAGAELTIRVVGREEGRALNRRYRGPDRPTNVLSFPFELPAGMGVDDPLQDGVGDFLGDLVICAPVVQDEAREQGKPEAAHWAHLVVHGVLHLIDYEHVTDEGAVQMEALETAIIQGLGFPPPYEEDPTDP
jgi:probable rRNA maturation factor